MGYLTLDRNGSIIAINLAGADMVGIERSRLINKRFGMFISDETRPTFNAFLNKVFDTNANESCEMVLMNNGGHLIDVHVEAKVYTDRQECCVIITDITERKLKDVLLMNSKERYKRITEAITDYLYTVTVQNGRPVETKHSEACISVTGYSSREFAEDPYLWIRMVPEEDHDLVQKQAEEVFSGHSPKQIEHRIIRKDGELRWVESSIVPYYDTNGNLISYDGIVRDITDRKQTAEALKESEEKFRNLFNNSEIAMFRTRIDGSEVLDVNRKFLDLVGRTREETLGKPSQILWVDQKEREEMVRSLVAEGRVSELEFQMLNKQGGVRDCITSLVLYREQGILEGSILDITERKQAEKALSASEMKFRNLLENIQFIGVILDLNGNITFCNDYLLRLTGWTKDEILNKSWFELFLSEDVRKTVYSMFTSGITEGTIPLHYENHIITREGTLKLIVWDNTILWDLDGKTIGVASIGTDVTEHRKIEQQLRQAQKMEAVGVLAGGVAHDFNNILSAIIGYASLLDKKIPAADPLHTYIDVILDSSEKAAGLVQSLLALSRKRMMELKKIDLNKIVLGIHVILDRIIYEDIEIKLNTADHDLIVMADKGHIEQVLMNLATNARDAMPQGGALTITTEEGEIDERFVQMHQYGEAGRYAVISVTDTGIGMDEKIRENIFEPFFTTKEVGKGTGLGLAMVYGTIKQHEGFINVYSEPGKGTTFRIYLPLSESGVELKEEKKSGTVPSGNETILLVEDNMSVRKTIKTFLEEFGYKVLEAVDGEDGLSVFTEQREIIQLIISDVVMPKKHGREMYEEAMKVNPGIKIIFMSGYSVDVIDSKSLLEEELHFMDKPVKPDKLLRKIREVLDN